MYPKISDIHFHYPTAAVRPQSRIIQEERDLPIVHQVDVLVAGGGVAGVAAALQAARAGMTVALIEFRNYFGFEYTASYRVRAGRGTADTEIPLVDDFIRELISGGGWCGECVNPQALLELLHARIAAEPRIKPFLLSLPCGLVSVDGRAAGVVMCNRSGRQIVLAKAVVDATENARLAVAAGAAYLRDGGRVTVRRSALLWAGVPAGVPSPVARSGMPGLDVCVHNCGGNYLEVAFSDDFKGDSAAGLSRAQTRSTAVLLDFIKTLDADPSIAGSAFTESKTDRFTLAPEVSVDESPVVRCRKLLDGCDLARPGLAEAAFFTVDALDGLAVAGRTVATDPAINGLQALLQAGAGAGHCAVDNATVGAAKIRWLAKPMRRSPDKMMVREIQGGADDEADYPVLVEPARDLPVLAEVDVLVAGGGTSGALAAIAAGREGRKVALIEALGSLGGTGSYLVNVYYWGVEHSSHLTAEIDSKVPCKNAAVGKIRFSGQTKMRVLEDLAGEAGVDINYWSIIVGVVREGNAVTGVVVDNAYGRGVIRAAVTIDASGHGDLACAAGASYCLGRESDGLMMEMNLPGKGLRDPTKVADISAFLMKKPVANPVFPVRESRMVEGDYRLVFGDILAGKTFADGIVPWRSNYDTHFPHSANQSVRAQDWMALLGLFRKTLDGVIPYRCLLPRGLDNLLVVGKAFATDHDSKIAVRMQRDLQHLGEAAGVAAAEAVRLGITPRGLSAADLQKGMLKRGILQEAHLQPTSPPDDDALAEAAAKLGGLETEAAFAVLYCAGERSRPIVRPLLQSATPTVREAAGLLAGVLNDPAAVPLLLDFLNKRNSRTFSYKLQGATFKKSLPLYLSAAVLLGRFKVREAVPDLIALLESDQLPLGHAGFVIDALGAIGDPCATNAIRPYLRHHGKAGKVTDENIEFEKLWGISATAARVLALLGDRSGIPYLRELLGHDQSLVRAYARRLLREIEDESKIQPSG